MTERCPRCKTGLLAFRWFAGRLRLVCTRIECRCVFDAQYALLGVLEKTDEMYAEMAKDNRKRRRE